MVYTDLLFFLALLPISVLVSFFDRSTEYKNLILVITSLIFFSWGKPFAICLMFLSSIVDWLLAMWIDRELKKGGDGIIPLFIDGIMNGAILIFVTNRFLYVRDDVFDFGKIIVPLSIGFYCLKGFCYVYDVYKKNVKAEKNVFCVITYMTAYFLMPVGGEFNSDKILAQVRNRNLTLEGINAGLTAFVCGLSKAVILAPALRKIGQTGLENQTISLIGCWAGITSMIGFTYFLFTGFCDISYGLGRIYGFNFNRNYRDIKAKGVFCGFIKNINISLSDLLSKLNGTSSVWLKCLGAILLSTVGAVWYNRSEVFVIAGITLGIFIILEMTLLKAVFEKTSTLIRTLVTYVASIILCGMVFSKSVDGLIIHLKGLLNIGTVGIMDNNIKTALLNNIFIVIIAVLFVCTPLKNKIKTKVKEYSVLSIEKYGKISVLKTILTAILFMICIVIIVSANINL